MNKKLLLKRFGKVFLLIGIFIIAKTANGQEVLISDCKISNSHSYCETLCDSSFSMTGAEYIGRTYTDAHYCVGKYCYSATWFCYCGGGEGCGNYQSQYFYSPAVCNWTYKGKVFSSKTGTPAYNTGHRSESACLSLTQSAKLWGRDYCFGSGYYARQQCVSECRKDAVIGNCNIKLQSIINSLNGDQAINALIQKIGIDKMVKTYDPNCIAR